MDYDMFLCWVSHSSAGQELQARHDNRPVTAHVCAACPWQHHLCRQHLCEVGQSYALFNLKTSISIQKRPPCTGSLSSETLGDRQNIEEMFQLFESHHNGRWG